MSKIPFDIKYRPQIESGEYKVETKTGVSVRIICWDANGSNDRKDIIGLVGSTLGSENIQRYDIMGHLIADSFRIGNKDLFIVTPEEELTPFEQSLKDRFFFGELAIEESEIKEIASELLFLAREQFIKDGYIIEKKAFHDAVEKVSPEVMKEVSENIDNEIAQLTEFERAFDNFAEAYHSDSNPDDVACCKEYATKLLSIAEKELSAKYRFSSDLNGFAYGKGYEDGMKEALEDLPRWIPNKFDKHDFETCKAYLDRPRYLCYQNKMIDVSELVEKLPGFKEDENHE